MLDKVIRHQFSRIGLAIFFFIFLQQLIAAIIINLVTQYASHLMSTGWFVWASSYLPLYLIGFPVCMIILRTIPDTLQDLPDEYRAKLQRLNAGQLARIVLVCMGITFSLNLVSTLLSQLIEQLKGNPVENPLLMTLSASNPLLSFFIVVIVAPIMEEIVFRGFLYKKMIAYGEKTYILLSALIFALFHANLYQLLYAFALGALFAWIVCQTKSIRYTILLHFIVNFLGSGVTVLLSMTENKLLIDIWSVTLLILLFSGIVYSIVWLVRNHRTIRFAPPVLPIHSSSLVWLNLGMILYLILTVSLAVLNALA